MYATKPITRIIGICRFSFLGRGDWKSYRGVDDGDLEHIFEEQRQKLYAPNRMEFRLWAFEHILLPSIIGQDNGDFTFIVLTSSDMPDTYLERLTDLCSRSQQTRLIVSDMRDMRVPLSGVISEISENYTVPVVQFRIDDDDCLSSNYISSLAKAAAAMESYPAFVFTMPKCMIITGYPGEDIRYFAFNLPFHSAGVAIRGGSAKRNVFGFAHFGVQHRFPSVSDPSTFGSVQLKFAGHDSARFGSKAQDRDRTEEIDRTAYIKHCENLFPHMSEIDFNHGFHLATK